SGPGRPVRTLQKAQARVQVSPMIMKVACFLSQHSPILGQPASSHTVWRPFARTIARVARYPGETGALTRIQSGFLSAGESGRCAFSGWRTHPAGPMVSSTTANGISAILPHPYLRAARGSDKTRISGMAPSLQWSPAAAACVFPPPEAGARPRQRGPSLRLRQAARQQEAQGED